MFRRHLNSLLFLALVALVPSFTRADPPPDAAAAMAPYLDSQTIAVGRLDLRKLDVKAGLDFLGQMRPGQPLPPEAQNSAEIMGKIREVLVDSGAPAAYVVVRLEDFFPGGNPLFVFPVANGKRPQEIVDALSKHLGKAPQPEELFTTENAIVFPGNQKTRDRLKNLQPAPCADLARALAAGAGSTAQLVILPTEDSRRVVREVLPKLPPELGGIKGESLVNGVRWISLSADLPPKISLSLTIQSQDAESAAAARTCFAAALELAAQQEELARTLPGIKNFAKLLLPEVRGDQLLLTLNEQNGGAKRLIDEALKPLLEQGRKAAGRAESINNLKQLMLAMHNYHDTFGKFPAHANYSKAGKPLLSWRVHLLPFVEQAPLYQEFHLDEPWDSEHNMKLIARMPPVLASPALPAELVKKGMTTYLAPLGERTVFGEKEGVKMQQITDGTSNTLALVEASADSAVVWTKPDDLAIDPKDPLKGLRGVWKESKSFLAGFCDGSVRAIQETIDPKTLKLLLSRDDGEPIGEF